MDDAELEQIAAGALAQLSGKRLGLAVSGGGDSMALLHLVADWGGAGALMAATVDHGLRPQAADEARNVGLACKELGVPHKTLRWQGWAGQGNLQDQARRARYALLADWAKAEGLDAVLLGHTADDVAETFLMRLARRAGIDGLSAMAPVRNIEGVTFQRPLVEASRQDLRGYLRRKGLTWAEDPSNEDPRFARVRMREALSALAGAGIEAGDIAAVAAHLAEARESLDACLSDRVHEYARIDGGDIVIGATAARALPTELRRRFFSQALTWVGAAEYGPRGAALAETLGKVFAGEAATLHGCLIAPDRDAIRISRELNEVSALSAPADAVWDGRWRLKGGAAPDGAHIAALGAAGLAECPDWRATGRPRQSLLATPALWKSGRLLAAPLAGFCAGFDFVLCRELPPGLQGLLSH